MSLIKCCECGKDVSEYALNCCNCGCPVEIIKRKLARMAEYNQYCECDLADVLQKWKTSHCRSIGLSNGQLIKMIAESVDNEIIRVVYEYDKAKVKFVEDKSGYILTFFSRDASSFFADSFQGELVAGIKANSIFFFIFRYD